jgi:hypothetical protein
MYEALCRPFGTTLDIVHDEGRPPITPRTWGLAWKRAAALQKLEPSSRLPSVRGESTMVLLKAIFHAFTRVARIPSKCHRSVQVCTPLIVFA